MTRAGAAAAAVAAGAVLETLTRSLTATSANGICPIGEVRGARAGASAGGTAGFSSSAAVISQVGFLNRLNGTREVIDRVLTISASLPRSLLISSRPSCSDRVL